MNYLSHFYIDHITGDYYYNTGLLLPDITKGMVTTFKTPLPDKSGSHQLRLHQGCLKHYESDRKFHSSVFFERYNHMLNEALKHAGFSHAVERKWFLSHILLELFVDRAIVRSFPSFVDDFYDSLNKVEDELLIEYLKTYHIEGLEGFLKNFDHFRSMKYIYYYTDNNKFVYSLNRIMLRAGLNELNDSDLNILRETVIDLEKKHFSDAVALTNDLKEIFA